MPRYKCTIHLPTTKILEIDVYARSQEDVSRLIAVHLPHHKGLEIKEVEG